MHSKERDNPGRLHANPGRTEIGLHASLGDATFLGVFEHFYETNRFANPDYGTHYLILAYKLDLNHRPAVKLDSQHSEIRWMSEAKSFGSRRSSKHEGLL